MRQVLRPRVSAAGEDNEEIGVLQDHATIISVWPTYLEDIMFSLRCSGRFLMMLHTLESQTLPYLVIETTAIAVCLFKSAVQAQPFSCLGH